MGGLLWTAVLCCLLSPCSRAQQTQSSTLPDAPASSGQTQTTPPASNPIQSSVALFQVLQQKSRVFPDLATNVEPFGTFQKFKLAANNSVSFSTVGQSLVAAGFSQAINSARGYGQGFDGYAKRFGADMARSASTNLFGTFLIASVMHEDPRFYVKRGLSLKETLKYAGQRLVYTRSDSGDKVVNYDGLLGPLASEGLANTYYPKTNRGVGSTFIRYGSDQGWKFCGNVVRQYWPRINRKLRILPEAPSTSQP
jgi:hypothetical protein